MNKIPLIPPFTILFPAKETISKLLVSVIGALLIPEPICFSKSPPEILLFPYALILFPAELNKTPSVPPDILLLPLSVSNSILPFSFTWIPDEVFPVITLFPSTVDIVVVPEVYMPFSPAEIVLFPNLEDMLVLPPLLTLTP
ncbi:hypothetical protein [Megasphaera sp. ASD88]|uniref:hypothetical protein n=1 Tax=Megasphaera sp. ASD88 TaxID=2027407 RepID=UPI001304224A|nr:hypothetical protein [Megasphaera sp. ASD88]